MPLVVVTAPNCPAPSPNDVVAGELVGGGGPALDGQHELESAEIGDLGIELVIAEPIVGPANDGEGARERESEIWVVGKGWVPGRAKQGVSIWSKLT